MGKKRKFNRFIRWIKSDLPEEEKSSVLLLGVTKLSSPKLQRRTSSSNNSSQHKNRPHTLHFEFPTSSTTTSSTGPPTGDDDNDAKQSQRRISLRDANQINQQPLTENTQNYTRKSSTPLAPSPSSSSSSRSSVTSSKENIAPSFSSIRSSSFSGRASSPEDKPRTNSVPRNSATGGGSLLHKRVSFSDETEAIIQSRDHARRTRDLLKANSQQTGEGEIAAAGATAVSSEFIDNSEINQRFIEEFPSVSYYNDYAINNECLDDLEDDDEIRLPSPPCPECRRKSIESVAKDEIGDILDVISNDLNIRPITRRNSSFDQTKFPNENTLEKLCEVLNEDEDDDNNESEGNSNVVHSAINKNVGNVEANDNFLDYNKNKYVETEKFYSENDIFDLFPKIVANQRRKLSTPITPAKSEDVDLFINEIIEELDIGPKLRRDSSRRPSQSQSTTSDSNLQFVATTSSTSSTSASILPFDSSITTTTTTSTSSSAGDNGSGGPIVVSEVVTSTSVNTSPESPSLNPANSNKSDSPDVVVNCLELDDQSTAAMDRSVDSIGSCSLDVDISTDFSDSSRGSVSDCTLRSVSILTPPVLVSNGGGASDSLNFTLRSKNLENNSSNNTPATTSPSQNFKDEPIIKITDTEEQSATSKKPSYLNLACCVNGYSNLTTYDSKLRESYRTGTPRSREVSPNRPGSAVVDSTSTSSYNGNSSYSSQMTKPGEINTHTTFLTPESANKYYHRITTSTSSPSKLIKSPKMTETTAYSSIKQNGSTNISTKDSFFSSTRSYLSKESRNFAASMLYDSTDGCINNKETKSYLISSPAKTTYSSSTITHSISSSSQEVVNNSKTTVSTTKRYTINGGTREYSSETSISENSNHMNSRVSPSKSFIQQRVERLYGPGALAQGFFIQTRHSPRKSESSERNISDERERERRRPLDNTNTSITGDDDDESLNLSNSTPSLPVLRHLRPEFRAQLPILSPKRIINENGLQKSTTVPIALKDNVSPQSEDRKNRSAEQLKVNGECNVNNESFDEIKESSNTTNQFENKLENGDVTKILNGSVEDTQELLLAAPTVVLPVVISNGTDVKPVILMNGAGDTMAHVVNGTMKISDDEIASITADDETQSVVAQKDGHYFLKILKNEADRLLRLAELAENELETKMSELPDDALGYLRSASGKARLLVNQKMQQFEGLCHKNINQTPGEQFPTTAEDLQGFWDMVMLQITQVNDLFKDLDELRANNWIHEVKIKKSVSEKPRKLLIKKPIPIQNTANSEIQRTKREAQRKLMLEQRRKAMAAKKNAKNDDGEQSVEIFVPENNTTTTTTTSAS